MTAIMLATTDWLWLVGTVGTFKTFCFIDSDWRTNIKKLANVWIPFTFTKYAKVPQLTGGIHSEIIKKVVKVCKA